MMQVAAAFRTARRLNSDNNTAVRHLMANPRDSEMVNQPKEWRNHCDNREPPPRRLAHERECCDKGSHDAEENRQSPSRLAKDEPACSPASRGLVTTRS
jgi:hypothetical protein